MQLLRNTLAKFLADCTPSTVKYSAADEKQNDNNGANYCYETKLSELLVKALSHLVINFCKLFEIFFVRLITHSILPALVRYALYSSLSHTAELKSWHKIL
ncbi:MAG: hypothetical protein CMB79_00745 [Filomicrobium sp.]|nr:hypothetical protein [Filomicrobium sp.]